MECEIGGCNERAKHQLYFYGDPWLYICSAHLERILPKKDFPHLYEKAKRLGPIKIPEQRPHEG